MKIGGRVVDGPKRMILVLPRDEGDIVFEFVAVVDDTEFEKRFPIPEPPKTYNVKLQQNILNTEDPKYKSQVQERIKLKNAWIFLQSIAPSNIEWDTVKLDQPETWTGWNNDLKNAGFSINEINTIFDYFVQANMVTESMIDEARKRFLASREAKQSPVPSSLDTEQQPSASGSLANGSVSALPESSQLSTTATPGPNA